MTITTSFMTFKQQLLLVMFVCALQVITTSASLSQPSDVDAKIDKFRKFATEQREMLSIFSTDNREILSLEQRYTIYARLLRSVQLITQLCINSGYFKDIIPEIDPNSIYVKSKEREMADFMDHIIKQLAQPSSVLSQYLTAYLHSNPATVEGVKTFVKIKRDSELTNEGRSELANYIVPLGEYMHKYDEAIDYITRQYQEHCLSPDGIVQQNKLYYLKVWWSSVKRINVEYSQDGMTQWEAFMATACPLPKEEFQLLNLAEKPLKLQNFDVPVPEKVKPLVPHLTMIKDCGKNFDLIHQLVVSFNLYRKMSPSDRSAHDRDLEIGYQKKFIVQQTIIRVMRKVPFKEPTSKLHWFGRAVNWAENNPWKTAGISYLLGFLTSRLLLSCGTPDPSTPFPNNTLPPLPGVTDRRILPIDPVWLIVGVMILVAIVLVGIGLCLICHRRNRLRKSSSDNGESDKTSKIAKSKTKKGRKDPIAKRSFVSSTRLLIGTLTSTKPSSSSPVRLRSSLYTTSAFTPSDILGTIHSPSRTNTYGSSQPVKSSMGKPNSNPSTPVSKPTKSPIPKIPTGVRRALDKKGLQPTSPSTVPKGTTKPEARDPKRVHKKKK